MSNPNPQPTYNQYKLRIISSKENGQQIGLGVSKEIEVAYPLGTKFTVHLIDGGFIALSGQDIVALKKQIKGLRIEDL